MVTPVGWDVAKLIQEEGPRRRGGLQGLLRLSSRAYDAHGVGIWVQAVLQDPLEAKSQRVRVQE
jgi:hypothetical protein